MKASAVGRLSTAILIIAYLSSCVVQTLSVVVCPDGESECPNDYTCCLMINNKYGCCPLPKAVCCSDHTHCCPAGFKCNLSAESCYEESGKQNARKTIPAVLIKQSTLVKCNGTVACPDKSTCCKYPSGYLCCELPQAVCCQDGIHCCPSGWECLDRGECSKTKPVKLQSTFSIKFARKLSNYKAVECPDGRSECPDGNTCCKLASGQYGCCPLPKAACCSDHIHCCPNGYTCDVSSGTCNRGLSSIPLVKKLPSRPVKKEVGNVICPGGAAECPDGSTCCKLASGQYGCCPLPKAVCCSDHIHCCPNGYTCDVSSGTCKSSFNGFASIPFMKISLEVENISFNSDVDLKRKHAVKNINCPDGSQCLDYETCCLLSTGGYGCCPLPNAVCCPDHEHCCPYGYICDSSSRTCYASAKTVPMIPHRVSSRSQKVDGVVDCPDGSECNNGETCCENESGKYSCCPLPSAVCCSDKKHCCPYGFTCDVEKQKCLRGNSVIPMLTKRISKKAVTFQSLPATVPKTPTATDDVIRFVPRIHREGQCHCGLYKTCCVGSGGRQHCCPLLNASCCADGLHCCPEGFTCDSSKGCIQN